VLPSHLRLTQSGIPFLESLRIGGLTFEPSARRFTMHARELPLTTMEYEILASLVCAVGQVVPRDRLMAAVLGRDASPSDRALDVHISHLRRKLGAHRDLILTVRSVGYMFRAPRA
jgi:two-component system response regulator CpxR